MRGSHSPRPNSLTFAALVVTTLLAAQEAEAGYFTVPFDSEAFFRPVGPGGAAAVTEFGLLTADNTRIPLFTGLPNNPVPNGEILGGIFSSGQNLDFYMSSFWHDATYFAASNGTDLASRVAFMDLNNSLRLGGRTVEQTSQNTWLLHLDDAASFNVDDNNSDVLIQIRLVGVPEPSSIGLLGTGVLGLVCYGWIVAKGRSQS